MTDPIHRAGGNSRTCLYVHKDLTVQPRPDLEDPTLSLISITVGRPRQQKFNFIAFYRQWSIQSPDPQTVRLSRLITSQTACFSRLTDLWEAAITERETITASDTNLSTELLLEQTPYQPRDANYLPIAKHFHDKILPTGVVIINKDLTHFSPNSPPARLDHITTTNPGQLSNVRTVTHGSSDHKYVACIRSTKAPVTIPRYRVSRDYRNLDRYEMEAMIRVSEPIKESSINTDPNIAAESFLQGLRDILDTLAPTKKVQTRSNPVPYISNWSRSLQTNRDKILDQAHQTNNPEDWHQYRVLHNLATQSVKNDQFIHLKNKFDSCNPVTIWQTVRKMAGHQPKGPPGQLLVQGQIVTSPMGIATGMNNFFINKIKTIIQSIPASHIDPLEGLKRIIATMTLPQPLQLKPVTRIELRKSIRSMKATKSTGTDGISMKIIKDFLPLLEPALENIVNQSILHNTFPDILKESKIIPIQKPETKPNIPASYRPINILPGL